jgi:hypothetical protein
VETECAFRVTGKVPELWHPDSGRIETAPIWREEGERTVVWLRLEPRESLFVVFRRKADGTDHVVSAKTPVLSGPVGAPAWNLQVTADGKTELLAWTPGRFEFWTAEGRILAAEIENVPPPLELNNSWLVRFPPNWGAPESVTLDKLMSWTAHPEEGVRYFSGTATYEKDFDLPADLLGADKIVRLDLGSVKNIAEVSVNGKDCGILWKAPFQVDVTEALRAGRNRLEIRVTNLWPNRMIGDARLPPDKRFTYATWNPYKADSPLLESGLLGPVRLRVAIRLKLKGGVIP